MSDGAGVNPWSKQFQMGPKQQSPLAAPNLQQAGKVPQQQPSPFPSSGFAKQGMGGGKSPIPNPVGGGEQ